MRYKRILLKLSGESFGGDANHCIDEKKMAYYAQEIALVVKQGVQVAIVVGGGNIFRGLSGVGRGFDRVKGDQMGMLATVINSIGFSIALKDAGIESKVFTSTPMTPIAEYYMKEKAIEELEKGCVVLIAGGTGNPFFTTDSASALRACEIGADALLKGTRVNGIYTADPEKDPSAVKYDTLTYQKALTDNLKVMDSTAFALCWENNMELVVFNMDKKGNLAALFNGEQVGTKVSN